jgi:hypothetical protein
MSRAWRKPWPLVRNQGFLASSPLAEISSREPGRPPCAGCYQPRPSRPCRSLMAGNARPGCARGLSGPAVLAGPHLSTCQTPRRARYRMIGLLLLIWSSFLLVPGQVHHYVSAGDLPHQVTFVAVSPATLARPEHDGTAPSSSVGMSVRCPLGDDRAPSRAEAPCRSA